MEKIVNKIGSCLKAAFKECGYQENFGVVTVSNRPDLCQYQCNGTFAAAKQYKKAPIAIASEVVEKINKNPMFSKVEAVMQGFINISISDLYIAEYIKEMSEDKRLGLDEVKEKKTIIIDYGGPNVAKPLHVGHLRSAVIGESVKRLNRHLGHNVIGDVHLGDWGLQMGLIIEQLRDEQPDLVYFDENFTGEYPKEAPFTISELERIYPEASAKSKQDEVFKERAHIATVKLQEGKAGYLALWRHIMTISKEDLMKNYDNMNVSFDLWKGESDVQPYIPDMIEDMIKNGYAYESQGAIVVDIAEETDSKELPPCIVRKSDGAAIYATTDLATIVERMKLYNPDKIIYCADKRQELHFTQIFRTAYKTGIYPKDRELEFIGFGTMNGSDGKPFKTRSGGVMRLENLISDISSAVYDKIMENRQMDKEEALKVSKIIGIAALKYGDLSNQASKDYVFDVDRFSSFEGNTGPYILYTMVRIKSILENYKKGTADTIKFKLYKHDVTSSERDLMLICSKYNDAVEHAALENAPHKVCQYIYELASAFNAFYHENHIMTEQDKDKQAEWIALIMLVLNILNVCISLLGFEAPDRM